MEVPNAPPVGQPPGTSPPQPAEPQEALCITSPTANHHASQRKQKAIHPQLAKPFPIPSTPPA
ncbi:hypothetical protein N658DRAFT_496943 [Parathielavia hyrcaniae]|uniref:Uncharacterized protein n=1 Tax=Parathielavia hyrcaniae TaxID=113614 RepID=A0AAN6Q329_9PEZI|nr:hypothetical protein N658DRAFT_496943 [Parathielavia hyrcaniae]